MIPLSCRNAQPVRLAIATLVAFVALAGSASAHSAFQEASPEPGAHIDTSPGEIVLAFSEPLNRSLTLVRVVDVRAGRRVPSTLSISAGRRVIVRPDEGLVSPAAYRVDWHTVSTQDGHALEGSFGFGVRTAAIGGEQRLEQSSLARDGWLRVLVRGLFYGALLFVAGGLFTGLLLSRSGSPWGCLRVRGATDRDLVERAIDRAVGHGSPPSARSLSAPWRRSMPPGRWTAPRYTTTCSPRLPGSRASQRSSPRSR